MKKIIRAKEMGFCFGVKGAVELSEYLAKKHKDRTIYMLGMLVHNEHVIKELEKKGVKIVTEEEVLGGTDTLKENDIVIIRAHGTIKSIYEKLLEKKVEMHDAACVFVTAIRKQLVKKEKEGYQILFVGDKNHPEVKGIISFGKNIIIVKDLEEFRSLKLQQNEKYVILTQTTLNKDNFLDIKKYVESNYTNVEIFDKICGATYERQKAVKELAKNTDVVLVVGGKKSSNTKKLYEVSKKINDNTYLIQDENALEKKWFEGMDTIGITAGASTPEEIIKKIENIIRGTIMSDINNINDEMDFEAMLNDYMPEEGGVEKGEKVKGIISQIDRNYAYLDVAGRRTAVRVRSEELTGFTEGDEIEVVLKGETKENEFIIGSRYEVDRLENLEKLEAAFEAKEIVKGLIERQVKGGYIVKVLFQQAFLPNSLSEIPMSQGEKFVGQEIDVLIKDVKDDRRGKKILVSKKDITIREESAFFETLNTGDVLAVSVKNILDFGISVNVGKSNGFIHISELSWGKINNIADHYTVGDKFDAKVISLDKEKRSLKLSIKQLLQDPWSTVDTKYPVGTELEGRVSKIVAFGAFVELEQGVEGLVHLSDFTWNKKKVNLSDFVKVNDKVKVKVIDLDMAGKKLKFGIKQLSENPWDSVIEKYSEGSVVTGKIVESKPFGIFVELEEGIDAFVHQSDFSWFKNAPKFKIGDSVELKVLNIDTKENKIKGGVKQLTGSPWAELTDNYKVGDIVERAVTSITDFGIFIEMVKGVDGMIHTSQVSKTFIKDLKNEFQVGQEVRAQIIEIDSEKKRVKLSIKKVEIADEERENRELLEKYGTVGDDY